MNFFAREPIENHYRNAGIENIFWTDCTKRVDPQWDRLRRKMLELLQGEHRFNRTVKTEYQVMVVGIPNVCSYLRFKIVMFLILCFRLESPL